MDGISTHKYHDKKVKKNDNISFNVFRRRILYEYNLTKKEKDINDKRFTQMSIHNIRLCLDHRNP
jgi:hypothetical protein